MTRAGLAGVAMCAVLAGASGCKGTPGASSTGSKTGSGGSNADVAGSGHGSGAPVAANPTTALVKNAFGGNVPAFPLLARDGSAAAISVESPIGRSEVSTYSVAIFTTWTAATDAWGSNARVLPIVDVTMATMLLDGAAEEGAPAPDPETLRARAAAVTKQLNDGGFSPFDGPAIALGPDDTAVGPVKLRVTHDAESSLIVHLIDRSGNELASNTILRQAMGHVADLECVSTPVARRAWFDAKRKRVLVEVGWNAGPAMCGAPDPEYGVWQVP